MRSDRSAEVYRRAVGLIPGGVNSPVRAMGQIGRDPIYIERAEGCELIDVDGNRYVDWIGSWGPMILGHGEPSVVEAVRRAAGRGSSFGAATEAEVELADRVAERVPAVEMLRMTSSGTEAAMSAIRLARALTGRDRIVKFAGAYHGHSDGLLAEAGSGVAEGAVAREGASPAAGVPASPGVTAAQAADTIVVPWNDRDAVAEALAGKDVAALIAEPVPANMGVVPPDPGYLEFLRATCDEHGSLLIFDEVITGFRVARGGAQELYGVMPDLTVFGKVIGGGLPAAAVGGPAELLSRFAPVGDVYQAGTLSGNPVAVAAGLATLDLLDAGAYERLGRITRQLVEGLEGVGRECSEAASADSTPGAEGAGRPPWVVQSVPGLLTPFITAGSPVAAAPDTAESDATGSPPPAIRDFASAAATDAERHGVFCRTMLEHGIYPPPSRFEAWFPSLAHDEAAIDRTVEAARIALAAALEVGD